jgi:uncharacterized membrane protein YeaQ/YmgE (transglycosylase-associated protein family)
MGNMATMSNLVSWVIFGLVVGIITHLIDPADTESSIFGTTLLGILGAVVGGLLANLLFGVGISGFNLISFIIAIAGSMFLLFVQRAVRRV